MIASVACLLAVVFGACCVLLAAFIGSLLYMVLLHHRLKPQGLARERALLATPLPPDAELPHVEVPSVYFRNGPLAEQVPPTDPLNRHTFVVVQPMKLSPPGELEPHWSQSGVPFSKPVK